MKKQVFIYSMCVFWKEFHAILTPYLRPNALRFQRSSSQNYKRGRYGVDWSSATDQYNFDGIGENTEGSAGGRMECNLPDTMRMYRWWNNWLFLFL